MKQESLSSYKVALVALDLTEMDDSLIRYAAMMSKVCDLQHLYFVHIVKSLELPEDLVERYPDLMAPLDESIQRDLEQKVAPHFEDQDRLKIDYVVQEGNTIHTLLKLSKVKEADLIMMGRKKSLKGSGIVTSHIARKCPCSLLLVPEIAEAKLETMLLPTDFSNHSAMAAEHASQLAAQVSGELSFVHIYKVPIGFYKTGKSFEEFAEIMKCHAQNDFAQFKRQQNLSDSAQCHFLLNEDGNNADQIYHKAAELGADMIVIGSKGRTAASSILMGSVAERITYRDNDIPILIVKKKGENMGFLEAFLKL